jgi:hypothetical protein
VRAGSAIAALLCEEFAMFGTMTRYARVATAAALYLVTGCGPTAPPGGGFTNGEPPMLGGPEKAAERADLPVPDKDDSTVMPTQTPASSPDHTGSTAPSAEKGSPVPASDKP